MIILAKDRPFTGKLFLNRKVKINNEEFCVIGKGYDDSEGKKRDHWLLSNNNYKHHLDNPKYIRAEMTEKEIDDEKCQKFEIQ